MKKQILISDIIEFSAFFSSGCYTAYEINSICTMYNYKLCLLITVNILFNIMHK